MYRIFEFSDKLAVKLNILHSRGPLSHTLCTVVRVWTVKPVKVQQESILSFLKVRGWEGRWGKLLQSP